MDAKGRLVDTFSSIAAYLQTFDSACPKQVPSNGSNKPKLLHDTIEIKVLAHVCKLDLSYLRNAKILWVKENLSSSSYNLGAIGTLFMFETSNNLMVTRLASQSLEIKFTTSTKTSLGPLNIHKSKAQVANI
jgi:hypothetical protein